MVDSVRRKHAAELIRHFINGRITNREFNELYPLVKNDNALSAIKSSLWRFHDDSNEHYMEGDYEVSEEFKSEIVRWVVFLYNDLEYEWPVYPLIPPGLLNISNPGLLLNMVGLGLLWSHYERKFRMVGDYSCWPFMRREDYEEALRTPPLLNG